MILFFAKKDSKNIFEHYLGIKYLPHGETREAGFDCYGLCLAIYREHLNIELPPREDIINAKEIGYHPHTIAQQINRQIMMFERIMKPQPYALALFQIIPPWTSHISVVLPDSIHFIHILNYTHVTIERLNTYIWQRRLTGFYIYNGGK